jgi:hypothetical protein
MLLFVRKTGAFYTSAGLPLLQLSDAVPMLLQR